MYILLVHILTVFISPT